jgi:hypothetical protein
MKYLLSALTALFLFAYLAPDANAFVCARGVYRAGCVGPRGGFVVRRGPRCIWRRGIRAAGNAAHPSILLKFPVVGRHQRLFVGRFAALHRPD